MNTRWILITLLLAATACGGNGQGDGPVQRITVRPGASFSEVADSLDAKGVLDGNLLFRGWARLTGAAADIKAGTYEFREGAGWKRVLADLTAGRVASHRLVVPEGWDVRRIAPALARLVGRDPDSLMVAMLDSATAARFGVPGPTLEGYLYPATYIVPAGADADTVISHMVREYRRVWTPERQALADSAGMSEREVVTLASIVEKEAKVAEEMPSIAAVYLNRIEIGYPLQADPTVQYALGDHQRRLLYAHIDSVADHPYNTYRRRGLPPGPIGSPSVRAIDAVLDPADVNYLYFVARDDGSHVFNRHLTEHNATIAEIRATRRRAAAAASADSAHAARRDSTATSDSRPDPAPGQSPDSSAASPD
ncbi:MAG TPA: endolytic transglycosylase MltG [Longimicrobiales bacterium]|nr:endolytic transglycosylase MltG [Longimicrobiales bacterium]